MQQAAPAGAPLMAFLQPTLASLAGAAAGASAQSLMQLQQALLQQQAMLQQTVLAVQALWHEVPDPSTGQSVWVNVVTRETLPQSPLLQLIALLHGLHASVLLPLQMQRDGTAAGVAAAQQVQAHAAVQAQAQAQELARAQTQAERALREKVLLTYPVELYSPSVHLMLKEDVEDPEEPSRFSAAKIGQHDIEPGSPYYE